MRLLAGPAHAQTAPRDGDKVGDAGSGLHAGGDRRQDLRLSKDLKGTGSCWGRSQSVDRWSTGQCDSFRQSGELIRAFDTAYFMISVDTLEDNKAFAEKEHADFPMLAIRTRRSRSRIR